MVDRIAHAPGAVVLTTGRLGLRYSRLLFPEHEAILAGNNLEEALRAAGDDTVICGLPGLILKFINPMSSRAQGARRWRNSRRPPLWEETVRRELVAFQSRYPPRVRVVIVDRDGRIIGGESP
ncbi:hypothetical protein [Methanoculleus chikugoensis]|uniref:hypothetical protein n=1 Tax=Methanoculleus chikugoensis TaxID=118126 RepID=UPI000AE64A02|nr:hypothetical protein [Methanoculleus chikugoensis]